MRNARLKILLLVLVALALAVTAVVHGLLYEERELGEDSVRQVQIPSGTSVRGAAERLKEAGLLDAPWKLRAVYWLQGARRTIKAGSYEIRAGQSPAALLAILESGRVATVEVTIPEGLSFASTCQLLADSLDLNVDELLALCRQPTEVWRKQLDLPPGASLEGYLFPETYRFDLGVSAPQVLQTLLRGFLNAFDEPLRAAADSMGFSVHQVVTLASIVEAETAVPTERAKVSAVYHNRLAKHWKLEADPTVAYATGIPGEKLSTRDLKFDSPYNTYRNFGLPPGPINSPGRAALVAAVHPEPGFEAMYFVADGKGGHVFSRTWKEHRAAVRAYRSTQRAGENER
jgi:UPF0755 protein